MFVATRRLLVYLLRSTAGGHETSLLGGHACTTELAEAVGGQGPVSGPYGSVRATRKPTIML